VSHTNCVFPGDAFRYMTDNISMYSRNCEHDNIFSLAIVVTKIAIDLTCTGTEAVYKHAVRKVTIVSIHVRYSLCIVNVRYSLCIVNVNIFTRR